jgi:hypothetical protein
MQAWSHLNKYKGHINDVQIKQAYDEYLRRKNRKIIIITNQAYIIDNNNNTHYFIAIHNV